jgi:hypothetical protein
MPEYLLRLELKVKAEDDDEVGKLAYFLIEKAEAAQTQAIDADYAFVQADVPNAREQLEF